MRMTCLLILLGILPLAGLAEVPDDRFAISDKEVVYLDQNWSPEETIEFYSIRQGSPLMRKELFDALEQPDNTELFRDSDYLASFGFLPQRAHADNPDGYPVGFVAASAVEFNCSACHTSALTHGDKEYRIDGGQAMTDVETWLRELVRALKLTVRDAPTLQALRQRLPTRRFPLDEATKFGRFAKRLTGTANPRVSQIYPIVGLLQSDYTRRQKYNDLNDFGDAFHENDEARAQAQKHLPYGFGRLDALGAIMNQATAEILDIDKNAHRADAPVNYPAIWDAPQHHYVQWNGAVDNTRSLGPLGRNAGQVIGVFGIVDADGDAFVGYDSSVRFGDLKRAEQLITTLWSPEWPFDIDDSVAQRGRAVFVDHCRACHADMKRDDPNRQAGDVKIPIFTSWRGHPSLNTDPLTAKRFSDRKAKVGLLANRYKALPLGERFPANREAQVNSRDILSHMVLRVVARSIIPWRDELTIDDTSNSGEFYVETADVSAQNKFMVYKARPLNGAWATAPYLHNGSVISIAELLKPPTARKSSFKVGTTEYDTTTIGFKNAGNSTVDTSVPGNGNAGHKYGTALSDDEKKSLLEYLKTL